MKYSTVIALLLATSNTSAIRLNKGDDKPGQKDIGLSADLAFQSGRQVSAGVVAAQESFEANHTSTHATAMATAAKKTLDTKTSVWVPRNAVYLQIEAPEEKKPKMPNMGVSSDVALTAGRATADGVVAAQEEFMANANATHAKAMKTAAAKATADKTSVWVPRNAVYLQTQDDAPKMPNMGIASDKAFQAGRKEAKAIIETQNSIQSAQNSAHAKAMYDAKTKAYNDNVNVWAPRNAVFLQTQDPAPAKDDGQANIGKAQRVARDNQYKSSLAVVAAQQAFAAAHAAEWEKRTDDDENQTYDTKMSVWGPRNEVMLQTEEKKEEKKDKKPDDHFGDAQDFARKEGLIEAAAINDAAQADEAKRLGDHAATMKEAHDAAAKQKAQVYKARAGNYNMVQVKNK